MPNEVSNSKKKAILHKKYPLSSTLIYDGITILHYLFGGLGIFVGFNFSVLGISIGVGYMIFATAQMFILMPLTVCKNCVYYDMKDSRCISGLNLFSRKITKKGDPKNFKKRAEGIFCYNNIYMASFFIPIISNAILLIINFSLSLLFLLLGTIGFLVFRFFVIFPKIACLHCYAKFQCPIGEMIGVREL